MKNTKGDKTRKKKVVFLQTTFKTKLNIHKKHLNPSQTTKSHFCPIIDIMLNSILKEILHRTDSQIIKLLTLN
jgi:hypothetical protein